LVEAVVALVAEDLQVDLEAALEVALEVEAVDLAASVVDSAVVALATSWMLSLAAVEIAAHAHACVKGKMH
jgi:hypothetical protein